MLSYLQELEIVPFISKSSMKLRVDLIIVLPEPTETNLIELFHKLVNSLKLIKPNLSYSFFYVNNHQELVVKLQEYYFDNLLIFKDIIGLEHSELYSHYNLTPGNVLIADSLQNINSNQNIKKQLWQDLKKFLV